MKLYLTFYVDIEALSVKGFSHLGGFAGCDDLEVLAGVEAGQVAAGVTQDEGGTVRRVGFHLAAARALSFDGVKQLEIKQSALGFMAQFNG